MKKAIRNNVFETNSSSTHTISISENFNKENIKFPEVVLFEGGGFGWEVDEYSDIESKCAYLYTAIKEYYDEKTCNEKLNWIVEVLRKHGTKAYFKEYKGWDCYIDHSSRLGGFLEYVFENEDNLLKYIFGDVIIYTSIDNMDWEDKPEVRDGVGYTNIYKGN